MASAMVRAVDEVGIHYADDGALQVGEVVDDGEEQEPAVVDRSVNPMAAPRACLADALVELGVSSRDVSSLHVFAVQSGLPARTIDYKQDNRRFWLSAHNCQVPTPTSQT
jgi:hypothetical protein